MRTSALNYELSYQIFRLIANSPLHAKKPNVSEQGSATLARAAYDGYRVARNGSKSKQAVVVVERSQTSHLKLNLVQFPTMINGEDRWGTMHSASLLSYLSSSASQSEDKGRSATARCRRCQDEEEPPMHFWNK